MVKVKWILPIAFALLCGCDLQSPLKPSILVVAVEGLGFDTFSCDMPGFRSFCEESVRFTHAFAPSTQSQASLASLLTGQYPVDHQVRHNGSQFLSSQIKTLAEVAVDNNYRTLFVSGGAPIWRKSGFVQGFEVFDDNVELNPGRYYRPAREVFSIFKNWFTKEAEGGPFVSFLFLADLQFPKFATQSNEGEVREKSFAGQVMEVGESFNELVEYLKSVKRWNSTTVVLVGLNSYPDGVNDSEPSSVCLKSRCVQVALHIKPSRKERDNIQQWTIDKNVSLVDLGWTLFNLLGGEPKPVSLAQLQPVSLSVALNAPSASWSESRLVLAESAWPQWMSGGGVRWALRQNQFLFIHDQRPSIYNTLTDRLEASRLSVNDPLWTSLNSEVVAFINQAQVPPWLAMDSSWAEQISLSRQLWGGAEARENSFARLKVEAERNPHQGPWLRWAARQALRYGRWADLEVFAGLAQDELWHYVARSNRGLSVALPKHPCFRTFVTGLGSKPQECSDDRVLALWDWIKAESEDSRNLAREKFLRMYQVNWLDDQIGVLNYQNDLRWDVRRSLPEGPKLVELILALKEFESFRTKTEASFSGIDVRL